MVRSRSPSLLVSLSIVGVVAMFIAIVSACSVDVDLTNKKCPCPDGLVCDPSTNTCVTTLRADGGPPPAACNDATCTCNTNDDCRDPRRRYCSPIKTCVECVALPVDTCSAGGYCNTRGQCVVGCKAGSDCPNGQKCQISTHQCGECTADPDCAGDAGQKKCSPSGKCAETCAGQGTPCGAGGTCCGGFCLLLAEDVFNCGACGKTCSDANATPSCAAGVCSWKCADGYGHCAPAAENTGCETNIRSVSNCGGCGTPCTASSQFTNGIACAGDKCTYTTCVQGHYDKNQNPNDGCEAPCGTKNVICCPAPQTKCNDGGGCKPNGTCN